MKKQTQYRLRRGNQIIAYAEEKHTGVHFTGKHLLFWRAGQQEFDSVDIATPYLDKMKRRIFEGDIVRFKINRKSLYSQGVILKTNQHFILLDIDTWTPIPLVLEGFYLFNNEQLEIVSHLFTHPILTEQIKFWRG